MTSVNLSDLKAHLSDYARRVKAGETLQLCERNKPFAEIRPLKLGSGQPRPEPGLFSDVIGDVGDEFFAADAEIERDFYGEEPE